MTSVNPTVKLLDNGDYLTELTAQLKAAQSTKVDVDVIQYNFFIDSGDKANSPDPSGAVAGVENLLKGLAPKANASTAKVRVLLEGDHSADIKTRNTLTLNDLKAAGINADRQARHPHENVPLRQHGHGRLAQHDQHFSDQEQ
jgi:hypothetical protein